MSRKHSHTELGFTLLEFVIASCLAGILITCTLNGYSKLLHVVELQTKLTRQQKEQLGVHYYLWAQVVRAGFAGRSSFKQLEISADGATVWRQGVYGYSQSQLPPEFAHKQIAGDILQIAYAENRWTGFTKDLVPQRTEQPAAQHGRQSHEQNIMQIPRQLASAAKRYNNGYHAVSSEARYFLIEDGERSESLFAHPDGLHINDCRYRHQQRTARLYPLHKLTFFVSTRSGGPSDDQPRLRSLYRVLNDGRRQELVRGVTNMYCWFGVARVGVEPTGYQPGHPRRQIDYYPASEITAHDGWANVVAVKIVLTWANDTDAAPLIIWVRLRNIV